MSMCFADVTPMCLYSLYCNFTAEEQAEGKKTMKQEVSEAGSSTGLTEHYQGRYIVPADVCEVETQAKNLEVYLVPLKWRTMY